MSTPTAAVGAPAARDPRPAGVRAPELPTPRRVLILSANMGEGHNTAASALQTAIAWAWPHCEVERCDTWGLWGERFSRAMSVGYGIHMRALPLTYEVLYDAMCYSQPCATLTKSVCGRFLGPRLARRLSAGRYDLIISTYPFSSAALDWLRSRYGLRLPTVTYVPAFHVHPCWAYPGVDQHYVMYDTAAGHAHTAGFEQTMHVGAPPVSDVFGSVSKPQARSALDLDGARPVVLVSGGALALGKIARAVQALVDCPEDLQVIAVCGRGTKLAARLRALGAPRERLWVLDYVDNMHELMAAADMVVTNGAGVTVLEALCTPRPVIAFRPLAGHGRASAAEMMRRGLVLTANDVRGLLAAVKRLTHDQTLVAKMVRAARDWTRGRYLRDDLLKMGELLATPTGSPPAARGQRP